MADLYWASRTFRIRAYIDDSHRIRVVASGDFSGAGAAVLRGALSRVCSLPERVTLDAAAVTALSPDAAQALVERATDPAKPMKLEAISPAARPLIGPAAERGRCCG